MATKEEELIRRISSVIGHEIRNPMAVLSNSLYFIKSKIDLETVDPKVKKHIGFLQSEISNLDRLISRMLAFSRPIEPKLELANVNPLIEECLSSFEFPPKIKLRKKLAASNPQINIDAALFSMALKNLIQNAIDSMSEGGEIVISSEVSVREILIAVSDSGPGISAADLPRLFEPYSTTKPRGLGLGLALVKKIALAHKGRAEGENISAGGACFKLIFPK